MWWAVSCGRWIYINVVDRRVWRLRWSDVIDLAVILVFFFFNDTATTEIYTLSLHDALPI